jgi:hypothetical protein
MVILRIIVLLKLVHDLELGTSGDTITIPAGVTFDSSAATNTLPSTVVTTTGTQTLSNKTIDATQLTGTVATSNLGTGTASVDNDTKQQLTAVIELDTDDYVELYAYADVANDSVWAMNMDGTTSNNRCYWYGYKLIT